MYHQGKNIIEPPPFDRYPKVLYQRREKKPSFWFGLILFLIGFFLTLISLNIYNPTLVPNELRIMSLNKKQNILILGCDEVFPKDKELNRFVSWKGRTDTILILNCNPYTNTLNILNIPRDTRVRIPRYGTEKINFINSVEGPKYTKKFIERILRIKIDHYVVVNLDGLNKIINEIGGIIIDIPQRMEYHDYAGMLHINLFPGRQLLSGQQAIGYVRFRHDSLGDIGRIQRQQEFMRAVFNKLIDPITFTKIPEVVSIYKKTIITDLKLKDIIRIANFVRNVPSSNQNIVILPGEFGQSNQISYWMPNPKEIQQVINKLFYEERGFFRFKRINPKDIKVSIFNGSSHDHHLASKLSNILREYGYTVLLTQDYEKLVPKTKIFAQKANSETALQVKYDIGNAGELVIGNLGPPEADVTILAGDDITNLKLKTQK